MSRQFLKKPILSKKIEYRLSHGIAVTSCEMQGWRMRMEDSKVTFQIDQNTYLFAVFDGHGGPEVAHLVASIFQKEILSNASFKSKNYASAFKTVFKKIDEYLASEFGEQELKKIQKKLNPNETENELVGYRAGTTAIVVLVTKQKYIVANIGDSRAVLCKATIALSRDHKPQLKEERERIQKAGGYVHNNRVNGVLGLSRSFGDFQLKYFSNRAYEEQAISSVPEIIQISRQVDDNFIFLACDGIWERYENCSQKLVDKLLNYREKVKDSKAILESLWNQLAAKDIKEGFGCDNMTGILVQFL